jgi:hypothetical protein
MFFDPPPQITTAAQELVQEAARDRASAPDLRAALDSADKARSYKERSKSRDAHTPTPEDGAPTPGSSLNDVDSARFLASLDAITPCDPNVASTNSAARASSSLTIRASSDSASSVQSIESDTRVQQALQEAYDTPIHVVELDADED